MANEWHKLPPLVNVGLQDFYAETETGFVISRGYAKCDEPWTWSEKWEINRESILALATVTEMWRQVDEVKALVAQLRAVEFASRTGSGGQFCPWCYGFYPNHESDCPRQAALAAIEEPTDAT